MLILTACRIWALLILIRTGNLEPGVILMKFLIFDDFQARDSYKKNSYKKKNGVTLDDIVDDIVD